MNDDRARFEAMFTAHYPAVVRYAVRRVGPEGAQEVVAETFLTAWRRLDDVPEYPLPWLYATARRLVANELRRRRRAIRLGDRIDATPDDTSSDPSEVIPEQLRVRAALALLSAADQEVLRLSEWEQLTAAEAAQVLGCSTGAAKVRLHRARQRFARAVGADPDRAIALIPDGGSA
jgi:RNA polymerase sigma-70 factor (ECF subfamily)